MSEKMKTYIEQLLVDIEEIEREFIDILSQSKIRLRSKNVNPWAQAWSDNVITPPVYQEWLELEPELYKKHQSIIIKYELWYTRIHPLFEYIPPIKRSEFSGDIDQLKYYLVNRSIGRVPVNVPTAIQEFQTTVNLAKRIFPFLSTIKATNPILIPDTNVVIEFTNFEEYANKLNLPKCIIIIIPVIITELDALKSGRINSDLMSKISNAIRTISSLRQKGDVLRGVEINEQTVFMMHAKEPNFEDKPKWLDLNNYDDRIIATAMEIQQEYPTTIIELLSNDMNLQNKCAIINIPCLEY